MVDQFALPRPDSALKPTTSGLNKIYLKPLPYQDDTHDAVLPAPWSLAACCSAPGCHAGAAALYRPPLTPPYEPAPNSALDSEINTYIQYVQWQLCSKWIWCEDPLFNRCWFCFVHKIYISLSNGNPEKPVHSFKSNPDERSCVRTCFHHFRGRYIHSNHNQWPKLNLTSSQDSILNSKRTHR